MFMTRLRLLALACLTAPALYLGCNNNGTGIFMGDGGATDDSGSAVGGGGSSGAGGTGGKAGKGGTAGTGGVGAGGNAGAGGMVTTPAICPVSPAQCSDGIDNDHDGKIDSADPECVGPCDNDEGSFATGIPGDNVDACKQDCFFDGNSGMGDDGCEWNLKCDAANPGAHTTKPCPYDPGFKNCPATQSARCVMNCQKLTPNGCDCFGCCAVPSNGATRAVLLVAGCTAKDFGNPLACPVCTQQASCINTCEKCEICVGKPSPDPSCPSIPGGQPPLPPPPPPPGVDAAPPPAPGVDAGPPGPTPPAPQCPPGIMSCGPGGQVATNGCATAAGYFCQTGCCLKFVQ